MSDDEDMALGEQAQWKKMSRTSSSLRAVGACGNKVVQHLKTICGAGGTMSDDEDMAWGEQAQLAVEANAPHKQFPKGPGGNPKVDRRSIFTGSNFMRCLPDRSACQDVWTPDSTKATIQHYCHVAVLCLLLLYEAFAAARSEWNT